MRWFLFCVIIFSALPALAAVSCDGNEFLKSTEGKEQLNGLFERSKSLIISRLEDLGIEEDKVTITPVFPKNVEDHSAKIDVQVKSKNLKVDGAKFSLAKANKEDGCGLEVIISSGHLINQESGKDFGSLGKVKEFIRLK